MKPIATLSLVVRPSRRLLLVQLLAHAGAAGAVLASEIPPWSAAILLVLVGASLARWRSAVAARGLRLHGDGGIEIVGADGTASEADLHPHTLVLSFLVVLLYRSEGRLRSMTLLGDSLCDEDFRQLRLWLRWRSTGPNPA